MHCDNSKEVQEVHLTSLDNSDNKNKLACLDRRRQVLRRCHVSTVGRLLAKKQDVVIILHADQTFIFAQCYGQFGELKDWSKKLISSVRRTELKEPEITKSSSAIRSAAN